MRILLAFFVGLLTLITPVLATDSTADSAQKEPQKLAPYEVTASPFGYLGIKRGSVRYDLLRFITFRGGIAFLRADEFDSASPALAAGIESGDWIMGVNGKPIGKWSFAQLRHFGETVEIGQHIFVDIYRPSDHSAFRADVVVTRKPKATPAPS